MFEVLNEVKITISTWEKFELNDLISLLGFLVSKSSTKARVHFKEIRSYNLYWRFVI